MGNNIELVPINSIHILNPRTRNRRQHREIVDSIRLVGLKRPITVRRRPKIEDGYQYDLVCGQGRLEAFQILNQHEIPAIVIEASEQECLVMSLVENIARRHRTPLEQMKEIENLRQRGHSAQQIAEKIGTTESWVNMITVLLDRGEGRLLSAVERGIIPVSFAIDIARSRSKEIQALLAKAYEDGKIQGKNITLLREILEKRESLAKTPNSSGIFGRKTEPRREPTSDELVKLYAKEVETQQIMVKRADFSRERLTFIAESFRELLTDESFKTLLKRENLDSLPKHLAMRLSGVDI